MKQTHILGIIVIAVAISVIISTAGDASTYVTFRTASELAANGKDTKVHVVGKLKKDNTGRIADMEYQPQIDPNYFSFKLIDRNNEEHKVVYGSPKPPDFERSDTIVVIGNMASDHFVADKIVLKCPSKYQENEIKVDDTKNEQVKAQL